MEKMIGDTAGKIWKALGQKGEIILSQMPKTLNLKSDIAYQALGWLAREDKVNFVKKDGKTFIGLSDKERTIFNHLN